MRAHTHTQRSSVVIEGVVEQLLKPNRQRCVRADGPAGREGHKPVNVAGPLTRQIPGAFFPWKVLQDIWTRNGWEIVFGVQ